MHNQPQSERNQVFISYHDQDTSWLARLQTTLQPLLRKETIKVWDDTKILPGSQRQEEIEQALAVAQVAVLLVSANFLASDAIFVQQLTPLLNKAKEKGLTIVWVYLSACLYAETEIATYQAAHDIAHPLDSLTDAEQQEVLVAICQQIKIAAIANDKLSKPAVTIPANPFVPLNGAVENSRQLFGREREIKRVFELLNTGTSVALIGEKQVGKSSLLKAVYQQAETKLQQNRKPIYLNLGNVLDEEDFYETLCGDVGIPVYKGGKLRRALKQLRLLLILDEVEKMAWDGFTNQVRGQIRALADGMDAPLRLVIAANSPLNRLFSDSSMTSPFENICYEETISFWDVATARNFVHSRLQATPNIFTEDEIFKLITESGGNPWKLMNFCHNLYRDKA